MTMKKIATIDHPVREKLESGNKIFDFCLGTQTLLDRVSMAQLYSLGELTVLYVATFPNFECVDSQHDVHLEMLAALQKLQVLHMAMVEDINALPFLGECKELLSKAYEDLERASNYQYSILTKNINGRGGDSGAIREAFQDHAHARNALKAVDVNFSRLCSLVRSMLVRETSVPIVGRPDVEPLQNATEWQKCWDLFVSTEVLLDRAETAQLYTLGELAVHYANRFHKFEPACDQEYGYRELLTATNKLHELKYFLPGYLQGSHLLKSCGELLDKAHAKLEEACTYQQNVENQMASSFEIGPGFYFKDQGYARKSFKAAMGHFKNAWILLRYCDRYPSDPDQHMRRAVGVRGRENELVLDHWSIFSSLNLLFDAYGLLEKRFENQTNAWEPCTYSYMDGHWRQEVLGVSAQADRELRMAETNWIRAWVLIDATLKDHCGMVEMLVLREHGHCLFDIAFNIQSSASKLLAKLRKNVRYCQIGTVYEDSLKVLEALLKNVSQTSECLQAIMSVISVASPPQQLELPG